jgi:hypothetical protein
VDAGQQGGKIGVLLRLEPNLEQNVSWQKLKGVYRIWKLIFFLFLDVPPDC